MIINNRTFKNSEAHPVREGTERDEYNLIQTFYFRGGETCHNLGGGGEK